MAGTESSAGDEKSGHIWSVLPSFDPTIDDPREYADKVRFLHSICPTKDKLMLAKVSVVYSCWGPWIVL